MTDEQRADSLGYTGTPWAHTPNLDRVALSGTRFSAAYTPSPVCVSARVCLLTGRYGSSVGVLNNHHRLSLDDPKFLTWTFAAHGYQVASFGKHHYNCPRQAFDLEYNHVLGDRVGYTRYRVPVNPQEAGVVRYNGGATPWLFAGRFPGTVEDTPEAHNVDQALRWMRRRDPSRPYFLRISLNAPHTPVVTPAPYDTLVTADAVDLPLDWSQDMAFASRTHQDFLCRYAGTARLTEGQVRRARQCYYGYVACVDHVFGVLLAELDALGALENTVIAFVSDHGAHLGDHGFFQKQSFWEPSVRVPMFLAGAGIRQQTLDVPVSAGSLLPTLLELAGLTIPPQVQFASHARSLRQGTQPESVSVFSEIDYGLWRYRSGERYAMVRDGRWKLSLYRDPRDPDRCAGREDRVLFDLVDDPGETHNLADRQAYASTVEALTTRIDAWDQGRPVVDSLPV
jgi:iduronate 2-sulfatase